jgi:hypothetical protein
MQLQIDADDLRPLVQQVVREVLVQVREDEAKANGRLAYREAEAAALLGIERHRLRDARLRGELHARRCGKVLLYPRSELLKYVRTEG